MRLLHVHTLQFENFANGGQKAGEPPYIILSHRWLPSEQEVSYGDYNLVLNSREPDAPAREVRKAKAIISRAGWTKILRFCEIIRQSHAEQYAWIDTCCINKESSAELQESINSMYEWYMNASCCYVHLGDVSVSQPWECIGQSKWFKRGWTLQEYLTPLHITFVDRDWEFITKIERLHPFQPCIGPARVVAPANTIQSQLPGPDPISENIAKWAGVPDSFANRREIDHVTRPSVAQVFSWAAQRQTTRPEDAAYSLLGLLGINMPLLYGQGTRAFRRLQEEIIRQSDDDSIFAWTVECLDKCIHVVPDPPQPLNDKEKLRLPIQYFWSDFVAECTTTESFIATDLKCFANCGDVFVPASRRSRSGYLLTNAGVQIDRKVRKLIPVNSNRPQYLLVLNCRRRSGDDSSLCSLLIAAESSGYSPFQILGPRVDDLEVFVHGRSLPCTNIAGDDLEQIAIEWGKLESIRLLLPV